MKDLKEFKPLIKLMKDEKGKLILASVIVVICGFCEIFTGYLNGKSIECITEMNIKYALIYIGIYFLLEITTDGILYLKAKSILSKFSFSITIESTPIHIWLSTILLKNKSKNFSI